MFVARNKSGDLYLFEKMPLRNSLNDDNIWVSDGSNYIQINKDLFPQLTWEDEPLEITMKQEDTTLALSDNNAQQINHVWAMYATLQQEMAKLRAQNAYWYAKFEDLKKIILYEN